MALAILGMRGIGTKRGQTFSPSKHDRTGSVTKVILVTKINLNFTADDGILFSDVWQNLLQQE